MSGSNGNRPPLVAERRYAKADAPKGARGKPAAKATPRRKPVRKARGPLGMIAALVGRALKWGLLLGWRIGWRVALVVGLFIGGGVIYHASTMPPIEALVDGRTRGSVTLVDVNGQVFAWRGDQFGGMVTARTVSPHLHNAVIAVEDKRFYGHIGVSPRGVASAIRINLREGRGPLEGHGGSTITQQTAKLLCLGRDYDPAGWADEAAYEADCRRTTLWRKVQEAVYAMAMEARYSKEEILTIYLNRAYLGAGARGVEAASQRYFDISAAQVDPAQAAMLAGLLKAPSTYAPTSSLDRAQARAELVLGLMHDQGYLSDSDHQAALTNPADLARSRRDAVGSFFADWVMERTPSYFTSDTTEDVILQTTIDPRVQNAAEEALAWVFDNKVRPGSQAQAAIVVMSADGAVRAMVGGREETVGGFNRATMALRQTGSAFKPFVYATALELGMSPLDMVMDEPRCWSVPGSGDWCPRNYSNDFEGAVTLTDALAASLNVPAVAVSETVGRENVRTVAEMFGIRSDLAAGPAIALGASEATLIEMTGAYAGILNGGSAVTPYGLVELRLVDDDVPLFSTGGGIRERVISETAARHLTWMMYQVVERGTGRRAAIEGWQIAGKTGTTQGARDAWFIGFSGDYVTGVWMGYDDNSPLTDVTGSGLPADIWSETMTRVLGDRQPTPLPMQAPVAPQSQQPGLGMQDDAAQALIDSVIRDLQTDP